MTKILASPTRYLQGKGLLKQLAAHITAIGSHPIIIVDKNIIPIVMPFVQASMENTGLNYDAVEFAGECCMSEINRIQEVIAAHEADIIIGIGGGKTLDTTKAVGYYATKPIAIIPTVASSDAPCSSLSVLYSEDGAFDKYLYLPKSPDMVLVDSEIIAGAPARLLAAGMGDALSTYFEARACFQSGAKNAFHARPPRSALALAKACYDTLLEYGVAAMDTIKEKQCNEAVENIIEANIYLSGIGFESGGLAAAHAIAYAMDAIPATRKLMHGEKVAFGTLVQLELELAAAHASSLTLQDEIHEATGFYKFVGLPVSLADMGVYEITQKELMQIAEKACAPDSTIHNMPFPVTVKDVYAAVSKLSLPRN